MNADSKGGIDSRGEVTPVLRPADRLPAMGSRRVTVYGFLALLLAGAWGLYWLVSPGEDVAPAPEETWPRGRWRPVAPLPAGDGGDGAEEREAANAELARVLSLPYSRGGARAPERAGVTRYDPELAAPGYNLYTSGHAPEAILTDMAGRPVHRWRCPFERAFPDRPTGDDAALYFRRARLLPGGDLLALYQGLGLIRLDLESNLRWALPLPVFNDLDPTSDGRILTLVKEPRRIPGLGAGEPVLEDSVLVLDGDGRELERVSLLAALRESPFRPLLDPPGPTADLLHSNTVELLEGGGLEGGHATGPFHKGRWLVSLREVDVVAVVDPNQRRAVWARRGPWKRQHEPVWLDTGRLLVFDNRGGPGGHSRVVELDPESGEVAWSYVGDPPSAFSSPEAGTVARLANGNTLITESELGRAFEVTPEGGVVWEFVSPHRAGPRGGLVATLFEVVRVPTGEIESWLPPGDR